MALINVSKDGNDSNDGSTLALSKLTITAAHTSAVDGDVIRLCTPGGEWREDGGSGAIDLAKAGLTAGIDIIGMDPRNPPIISGISGTASVRISTSGYRFKNLVIDSSSDANTSLALINSSDPITVGFENVKFCATHDISTGSGYMLNMIGTGAHSLTLEDCEFEQWCRYLHGIYLSGAGAHRILRTKVNMTQVQSGVYGMRINTNVVDLEIKDSEFDGYYGILQSGEMTENAVYKITRSKIDGRNYAFLSNGAAATKVLRIFMDNVKIKGDALGFAVSGNNTYVSGRKVEAQAKNIPLALPNDGAYSGCRTYLVDCHTGAYEAGGHALLIGDGCERALVYHHHAVANFASFGAVIKGQNGVIKDSKIDGGTAQSLLLKGTINWQITGNIINQNVGGIAVDIRNGDPTPIASQVVLKGNDIEVSNGSLFAIGALTTQEDGTSVFDNNEYSVIHDGTWGTVRGTTVSSLQEVRDAWTGVTTNDDNSREKAYGSESGNLVSILGTPITEATAGNLAGNLSVFFDNDDATTTKTVDDVGGGTASDIRDAIGMAAADLDTQLDAILAGSGGAGTMTWDELLADHQGAGTFGAIFQARQYYAPSGSTIRYVTRGDSYDGTANAKLSWPVAVDYTTGWTGTLTVRHRTTNAVLLTKAVVVASAVLLECTLTVTDSAFALLTDDDEFGSHPYDVQLDDGTSQITVVTNGVMIIRRDNTTV